MHKIAILDYGSQLTHLLATEVRRLQVYSEILDSDTPAHELKDYKGIILSGGPNSVYEPGSPQVDPEIFNLNIPILGICYGHQLIVQHFQGKVESAGVKEYGKADLTVHNPTKILAGFEPQETTQVWMSHGDDATVLPPNFEVLASTDDCQNAVIGDPKLNIYSVQFHLEVNHTLKGRQILKNFLTICQPDFSWNLENFLEQRIAEIQQQVGNKKVFLMISGGVDSTVTFALLNKAIGSDRLYGLFVNTGFLRADEVAEVTTALESIGVTNLHVYDGSKTYFKALTEIHDPEEKRRLIGDLFLDIQAEVSNSLNLNPDEWLLAQGTIYPDTIESGGTKHAQKIKTHHNRVPRIEQLIAENRIIEPVKDLYKDEVRQLGTLLQIPKELVMRHPFPGPGLAVRILCTHNSPPASPDLTTQEEAINLKLNALYPDLRLKAYIPTLKSVGVQGDGRTYRHPLILEADSLLHANNHAALTAISTLLTNSFNLVNRVILKVNHTEDTIKSYNLLPHQYLTPDRVQTAQLADKIFNQQLKAHNLYSQIWQAPLVLAPLNLQFHHNPQNPQHESLILRPISSREAMTADVYPLTTQFLTDLEAAFNATNLPYSGLFYDLTNKPPGTIEWE